MAHNSAFFLIALLMFATANPLAHAAPTDLLGGLLGGNLLGGLLSGGNPIPMTDVLESLQTPLINLIQGLSISGMLCCTSNGSCPAGGKALSMAVVNLSCTSNRSGSSIIGQGRTDINGRFNINANNITGKIVNILEELPCQIYVQLVDQLICPILSVPNGEGEAGALLTALLKPISLQVNQVSELILNAVTSVN